MRWLLHKIAALITQHPREYVELSYKGNCVAFAFDLFQYVFGRREGIRFEVSFLDMVDLEGNHTVEYRFGTLNSFLQFWEFQFRDWLKKPKFNLGFHFVPIRQLATPNGLILPNIFAFAIAYDSNTSGVISGSTGDTTMSASYTMPVLSQGVMLAHVLPYTGVSANSCTYNSVAMTAPAADAGAGSGTGYHSRGFYKLAPSTGSNTIEATLSGSNSGGGFGIMAYSGVGAVTSGSNGTDAGSKVATMSLDVTTSAAGEWGVRMNYSGLAPTASTNVNSTRYTDNPTGGALFGDSNGSLGNAGTYSLVVTQSTDWWYGGTAFSIQSGSTAHTVVGTETVSLSETLSQMFGATAPISEQMNLSDTVALLSTFAQAIQEQIALSDSAEASLLILVEIQDSVAMSDSVDAQLAYGIVVTDTIQTSDSLSQILGINVTILEQVTLSDSVSLAQVITATVVDTLGLSDALSTIRPGWGFRSKNTAVWTFRTKNSSQN